MGKHPYLEVICAEMEKHSDGKVAKKKVWRVLHVGDRKRAVLVQCVKKKHGTGKCTNCPHLSDDQRKLYGLSDDVYSQDLWRHL